MSDKTHIEWTDATWNVITGCTLVDGGCTNCYAAELATTRLKDHPSRAGLARKNAQGVAKFTGEVRFNEQWLDQPLHWRKPKHIFVCAHGDLFHEGVTDDQLDRVFGVMGAAPWHTYQVLTKRPHRAQAYLSARKNGPPLQPLIGGGLLGYHPFNAEMAVPHYIWIGTSISDQASVHLRIPHLLATPAAVRFISAEPLLEAIDIMGHLFIYTHADQARLDADDFDEHSEPLPFNNPESTRSEEIHTPRLDWVICGGESGRNARPMHPDWARSLRDQCAAAGVAFHFKQWGQWLHESHELSDLWDWDNADGRGLIHLWNDGSCSFRLRKSDAGRLLDGREHNDMPRVK